MQKNDLEFLVVPSLTRYERLLKENNFDHDAVMKEVVFDDIKKDILDGYKVQKENRDFLKSFFGEKNYLEDRYLLTEELASKYKYIISAGGDEHFLWVTHKIGDTPIIGFKLDDRRSDGALLYFQRKNFEEDIKNIEDHDIENWTKVGAEINEKPLVPAVANYSFAEKNWMDNSPLIVIHNDKIDRYRKSSGLITATGTGSTGRYNSAHYDIFDTYDSFPKKDQRVKALLKETRSKGGKYDLEKGDSIKIISYLDHKGIAIPDAIEELEYPFKIGYTAKIFVSEDTLKVVKP